MKICSKCKVSKDINQFYRDARTKTGTYADCKKCFKKKYFINTSEYTKNQILTSRWYGIKKRCQTRPYKHVKVTITKEEFYQKFDNEDLDFLYSLWVLKNKDHRFLPSIDRINPDGDYESENMRWVTLSQNATYARHPNNHKMVRIKKMDELGNVLGIYKSIREAYKSMGKDTSNVSNISAVLTKRTKTAYGYRWEYI